MFRPIGATRRSASAGRSCANLRRVGPPARSSSTGREAGSDRGLQAAVELFYPRAVGDLLRDVDLAEALHHLGGNGFGQARSLTMRFTLPTSPKVGRARVSPAIGVIAASAAGEYCPRSARRPGPHRSVRPVALRWSLGRAPGMLARGALATAAAVAILDQLQAKAAVSRSLPGASSADREPVTSFFQSSP